MSITPSDICSVASKPTTSKTRGSGTTTTSPPLCARFGAISRVVALKTIFSFLFLCGAAAAAYRVSSRWLPSPCARGAMVDFADSALENLFEQEDKIGGVDPLPVVEGPRSDERQRDRCRKVYEELEVGLWKKLEEEKDYDRAKTVSGGSSLLSWLWMVSTPYDISTTLSNNALSVGLWNPSLLAAPRPTCPDCGEVYIHGHDDTCRPRMHRRTKRHDGIRNLLAAAIRRIKDSTVIIEPRIEERLSQHRSDMPVSGPAAPGLVEYDLTCISVHSKDARLKHRSKEVKEVLGELGFRAAVEKVIELQMEARAEKKRRKYAGIITLAFQPLVITLDGTLSKETAATFKHWRSLSPSWSSVSASIACTLLRTRAETYCLW
ncbi:hypothetical protein CF319_g8737 [Tilletia indica]|nr:hypothetical protein CF319_g8737 [Tilletia indica]